MQRATNLATLVENPRSACIVNRAVDATATHQRRIGGVDNSVDVLFCEIASDYDNAAGKKAIFVGISDHQKLSS
jgi:hypothetical protein